VARTQAEPKHRFLFVPVQDTASTDVRPITYGTFDSHVSRLAHRWSTDDTAIKVIGPRAIVGVFFPSCYTLAAVMFSLLRLGVVPFCISPRNSDEALKHLINKGNVVAMIAAKDGGLDERLRDLLQTRGTLDVPVFSVASAEVADTPCEDAPKDSFPPLPSAVISGQDIALMQHVSALSNLARLRR
jgi:acyl-CoA synthetase (AMP-forming)/AMP-acid ligase II